MSDLDHARMLVALARRDLTAARAMTAPDVFPDEIAGFLFQQAIEKALKAWLACLGVEYPKPHDISSLLMQLAPKGIEVGRFFSLIEFTLFAVQFRYETQDEAAEKLDRTKAADSIESLIVQVEKAIALI